MRTLLFTSPRFTDRRPQIPLHPAMRDSTRGCALATSLSASPAYTSQGFITNSPCTAVRWVPSSPTLFLVSHADGTIIVYDKEREDGSFSPQDPARRVSPPPSDGSSSSGGSWDPMGDIFVSMPPWHPVSATPAAATPKLDKEKDKEKAAKNPVSHWRVSRRAVVDFVFAPDVKYVAVVSEDGCLRIIDAISEQLVDCYASYFGALTSVAWSPDGRFIIVSTFD